jgi:hypothetical protein
MNKPQKTETKKQEAPKEKPKEEFKVVVEPKKKRGPVEIPPSQYDYK